MPLHTRLPDDIKTVDVIVAGGGTAGCVLAARLAEADPNLSILVIEQGMNNYNLPQVVYPALFPQNLLQDSKTALFWQGNQSADLANRAPIVPSGGILGGGFETYHGRGEREHHGYSGPINISSGTFRAKRAEDDFIDAAAQLGYSELKDLQNLDANNATERWLRYVGPDGKRQGEYAAHRFIHPKLQSGGYPNLHVLVENQAIRVLIDENKRAVGVEIQPNPKFQSVLKSMQQPGSDKQTVRASKKIIVSAGANGTPLILERSGIGDPNVLRRVGVPLVEALPGVGNEYQDHHLSLWAYRTSLSPRECINGFQDGRWNVHEAIRRNDELLGWNSMDASGKFRPTERDVDALGPAFRKFWDKHFKNAPDRPLMIIALYLAFFGDHATLPDSAEYVSLACWTAYPESRGSIHIKKPYISNEYPNPVDFDVGYLNDPDSVDVKKHIWSYKLQREMFRRMSIYRGELASSHPTFPPGSKAAIVERANGPVSNSTPKIEYTEEDDRAIEQKVRETVSTTWHSLASLALS
ncbi:hypothetical protein PRZ48_009604 [Zasmidium cellare]|uniref:Glucose-methanol-choline oxidoreductase N-terminal domain-containing protein n=1 Tax=Zasmidium cellare TaxID=395010 RepID=A0ABR0EC89_ZASCE|nr:hypothetical protein PRZ48_009604 [Zasmidium cellare]